MSLKINPSKRRKWLKNALYWFCIVLLGILLAIVLRVFFFATFVIPTPSMEPAIIPGDKVIVSKLIPGPRIIRNFFSLHKGEKPDITRLQGTRAVRHNDVLIFNYPYTNWNQLEMDMNVFYAKRCVAIPGDTFYIENGIYKIKNRLIELGNVTRQMELSKKTDNEFRAELFNCFPQHTENYQWTMKNFGPLYVPKEKDTISINMLNYVFYKKLIEYETGQTVTFDKGVVYLDSQVLDRYTFRQNYYFMAGDYIFDSKDSRYWGLLPEDHIVGKVAIVWQSKDKKTGKRRWERFFKTIN
jgi:signal peptidase I